MTTNSDSDNSPGSTREPGKARPIHHRSERAWLEHLRVMAELPYPSWLLAPALAHVLRAHLTWDVLILGWDDRETLQPTDFWIQPVRADLLQKYMLRLDQYVQDVPITALLESRGRLYRQFESHPAFEASAIYQEFFAPYQVRWGVTVPVYLGERGLAFLGLLRRRELGRYSDADQDRLDRVSQALSSMDRDNHPWRELPAARLREGDSATLVFDDKGQLIMQTAASSRLLFMASHSGLATPTWVFADSRALPPEVQAAFAQLVADQNGPSQQGVVQRHAWGAFDFSLEKSTLAQEGRPQDVVVVTVRHHEPLDIAVARRLWGWPLSPQEKRILIASTRNPGRAELAAALGLTQGTLRHYINQLQRRLDVSSRQELIDRVLLDP